MILTPEAFTEYELIDCGHFQKLERFGKLILSRPEPQALWPASLPESEWKKLLHAEFKRDLKSKDKGGEEKGSWILKKGTPEQWNIRIPLQENHFSMRLGMTSFKHVGIFPEQYSNWTYIFQQVNTLKPLLNGANPKILNLFAYTGGASLAARCAGADVTHLDAVKQVINWSRENAELSGLDGFRWMVDDALKFVQREVRRGNKYQGIILDPPAYGRGPEGEKWILQEGIAPLMQASSQLLDTKGFLILNLYSMGFSPTLADTLVRSYFPKSQFCRENGELAVSDRFGKVLPLSIFTRFFLN